jgi:hypothetical protein
LLNLGLLLLPQPTRLFDLGCQFLDPRHDPPLFRKRRERDCEQR